jgi:hypothetical protein
MTLEFHPKKSNVSSESSPAGRRPLNWLEKQPINPTLFDAALPAQMPSDGIAEAAKRSGDLLSARRTDAGRECSSRLANLKLA